MALLLLDASTGWSQQQYLYRPTAVAGDVKAQGTDGVLVQDVAVQKGDTLYGISRRFSGHGSYYPQILLFNDIKDPNLIYPGNVFKVPVSKNTVSSKADTSAPVAARVVEATVGSMSAPVVVPTVPPVATVTEIPTQELKKVDSGKEKKRSAKEKSGATKKTSGPEKNNSAAAVKVDAASGQSLFERAVKAYRQDDCRAALELFDRFLAENPTSPLAADASLYKAECYLKLSSQN